MSTSRAHAVDRPVPILSSAEPQPLVNTTPYKKVENAQPRRDIQVRLQYLKNLPIYQTEKPLQVTPNFLDTENLTTVQLEEGPEEILNDVRGREGEFTLDEHGFRYVHAPTKFRNWSSQPQLADEYLPELEELLRREVDGCDEIIFYDIRMRQAGDGGARVKGLSYNPFARQVHVDNTETSVREKIHNFADMKADYYSRARIINIWRPIKHPVYDCGLAISDGGKLQKGDITECDRIRQSTGKYWDTMGVVKFRPGFDWYYMSRQDESDVLLFKNSDSATDVRARTCLHTAFDVPPEDIPENAPARNSVEVRALVFTNPKGVQRTPGGAKLHPLAITLKQSRVKLIDDSHSITDRPRDDIDEAKELKDAMLLLRRKETRVLEIENNALKSERDDVQHRLEETIGNFENARQQLSTQRATTEALQEKAKFLEQQLTQEHWVINHLSKKLADARMCQHLHSPSDLGSVDSVSNSVGVQDSHITEHGLLLERIKQQELEIQKWKGEAMGRGNEAVSRSWQGSVDEAVRIEREKNSFVIKALMEEIESFKAEH